MLEPSCVIKFVSELRQVSGFLPVLRFPPPIKLTATVREHLSSSSSVFVLSYYVYSLSEFRCDVRYEFRIETIFVRLYPQLFVGGLMSYLHYLCFWACSGVQHILCCVFVLFVFVLCLMYPMLPISLDCNYFYFPSVFSNVFYALNL